MANSIKLLSEKVANQIAAGEVVNRPASVIKEMMENAVDAGASEITVNYRDAGKELIQIIDNGKGMSPADARMCFERHATSNIQSLDDIYSLSTFGFRGEALASIAAVSELEMTTRTEQDALASEVCISGGRFVSQELKPAQKGTQFLVKNLFYNVPARRRFLDKSSTEARHINAEFIRVALCNADKSFTLYNNDALVYQLGASSLKARIVQLVGKHMTSNLLEVKTDTSIIKIEGFVGTPSSSKQNNKDQYLFVNNRFFKSGYFHKAIISAYEKLIPSNTQPSYFLYLTISPERIDVNVHPQKTEVKFDDNSAIWQIINASTREALAKTGVVPMMDFDPSDRIEIPVLKQDTFVYHEPKASLNTNFNPFKTTEFEEFISPSKRDEDDYQSLIMEYIEGDNTEQQSEIEFEQDAKLGAILPLEGGRFFATTINSSLAIIDVNRAYSCVLYERYRTMLTNGNSASQQLMFTLEVELSPEQVIEIEQVKEQMSAFGFEFSLSDSSVSISAVPADFTDCNFAQVFLKLVQMLSGEQQISADELRADYLARIMSKTSSMRSVEKLALETLLSELISCQHTNYTPDSQRVISYLKDNDLIKLLDKK